MRGWRQDDARRLRAALRAARRAAGLTQVRLARKLGVQQDFISKYETGERRLDVIELFRVLEAIGVDPIEFVSEFRRAKA